MSNRPKVTLGFVDREATFLQLEGILKGIRSEGKGKAVLITGEPGIGKTCLVNEFLRRFGSGEPIVLRTSGLPSSVGPYSSMGGIFEPLFKSKSAIEQGKQVAQTMLNLARLVPAVGGYADVASTIAESFGKMSNHDLQLISASLYVRTLLVSFFEKLSKERLVIAFLDDVQWLDEFSLEALVFLIRNVSRVRALILINSRTGYPMATREESNLATLKELANQEEGNTIHIQLHSLERGPSEELVKQTLGGPEIDHETLLSLTSKSGGNPLLITRTVRELVNQRVIIAEETGWRLNGDPSKVIPVSVSNLLKRVLLRIQKENPDARAILDYAAILGNRFEVVTIATLANLETIRAKHLLEQIESVYGLIQSTDSSSQYTFDHDLTRETLLSSLVDLAKPYHLKVGMLFDKSGRTKVAPQLTAYHYEEAEEYQKAFELYREAAKNMKGTLAFVEEANYLERCLALFEAHKVALTKKRHSNLLLDTAHAQFSSGKFDKAFSRASTSLELGNLSKADSAEAHLLAGKSCRYLGTPEAGSTGMGHLNDAVSLFNGISDHSKVGEAYSSLATLADHFGDLEVSKKAFNESQKAFNLSRNVTGLATLQRKSGMIHDARRVIEFIENAIQIFRKTDSVIELARCYNNLGGEYLYIGEFQQAKEKLLQALELYRHFEFYEVDAPLNNLGLVEIQMGDLPHAREALDEAERRACEDFNRICTGANLATLERLTGSPEAAITRLSRLIPLVSKSGEPMIQDYFAFNMAVMLDDLQDSQRALEWLEKYPPNKWKRDDSLVLAKRLKAKSRILTKLGLKAEAETAWNQAEIRFRTNRPQKWFYQLDYYPCDIHILD